jgi:hypothetical protein
VFDVLGRENALKMTIAKRVRLVITSLERKVGMTIYQAAIMWSGDEQFALVTVPDELINVSQNSRDLIDVAERHFGGKVVLMGQQSHNTMGPLALRQIAEGSDLSRIIWSSWSPVSSD